MIQYNLLNMQHETWKDDAEQVIEAKIKASRAMDRESHNRWRMEKAPAPAPAAGNMYTILW